MEAIFSNWLCIFSHFESKNPQSGFLLQGRLNFPGTGRPYPFVLGLPNFFRLQNFENKFCLLLHQFEIDPIYLQGNGFVWEMFSKGKFQAELQRKKCYEMWYFIIFICLGCHHDGRQKRNCNTSLRKTQRALTCVVNSLRSAHDMDQIIASNDSFLHSRFLPTVFRILSWHKTKKKTQVWCAKERSIVLPAKKQWTHVHRFFLPVGLLELHTRALLGPHVVSHCGSLADKFQNEHCQTHDHIQRRPSHGWEWWVQFQLLSPVGECCAWSWTFAPSDAERVRENNGVLATAISTVDLLEGVSMDPKDFEGYCTHCMLMSRPTGKNKTPWWLRLIKSGLVTTIPTSHIQTQNWTEDPGQTQVRTHTRTQVKTHTHNNLDFSQTAKWQQNSKRLCHRTCHWWLSLKMTGLAIHLATQTDGRWKHCKDSPCVRRMTTQRSSKCTCSKSVLVPDESRPSWRRPLRPKYPAGTLERADAQNYSARKLLSRGPKHRSVPAFHPKQ